MSMPVLWVHSRQGPIGGVCEGLGQNPKLLRFLWLLSVILSAGSGGTALLIYGMLYFFAPKENE